MISGFVLGPPGCGKTKLIHRLVTNQYDESLQEGVWDDEYRTYVDVDGEKTDLDIFDTYGEYANVWCRVIKHDRGIVLAFDVTSHQSFEKVTEDYTRCIRDAVKEPFPIVIAACKCDSDKREVTTEEIRSFAESWRCPFFETSAKTDTNVKECFCQYMREYMRIKNDYTDKRSSNENPSGKCIII